MNKPHVVNQLNVVNQRNVHRANYQAQCTARRLIFAVRMVQCNYRQWAAQQAGRTAFVQKLSIISDDLEVAF